MMDATLSNDFPREFLPVVESVRRCPEHYALCPKGDCAKASCCLRAQMYLISPQEQRAIIAEAEKLHIPFGQDSFTTFFLAPEW